MIEHYNDERVIVYGGDCREVLAELSDAEGWADAIVCDPPYDLTANKRGGSGVASLNTNSPAGRSRIATGFMGKSWDGTGVAFDVETWKRCYDVLKPGGHLLAFGGSRTWHRMAVAIEDAGFEMRDSIAWLYGSGFPKSMDVSKAIDKAAGATREVVSTRRAVSSFRSTHQPRRPRPCPSADATTITRPTARCTGARTVTPPHATAARAVTGVFIPARACSSARTTAPGSRPRSTR